MQCLLWMDDLGFFFLFISFFDICIKSSFVLWHLCDKSENIHKIMETARCNSCLKWLGFLSSELSIYDLVLC